ncbi:unnamed protein product [Cuscuta epithymum]|nr:unnamed protein product [Cuscuta epithymum]
MVPGFSNLSSLECESCHLGKQPRKSFPRRVNNRATSPFDLVHTDVWGPYRVTSTLGFRYFVIFVDDFSRYTWLFLMKERFELFHIFQTFCAEIQTQFGHSIKILRSDNAKEFFGASFNQFMTSRGMLHQSSCVHTPQQNGVAERKNRHLVDTARTLLLHSHTPPQYWADAVLTACHLINRMPSSVLNNEIPYSILFPARDLFPLPPHVFGCVCFVHDTTPGLAKMAARSIKCIFLGYSRLQKGYRCYSPLLKKHFISADVTFIESSFYYPLSSVNTPSCLDFTSYLRPIHQEPPINPPSDEHPNCPPMSDRPLQVYHRRPRPPPIEPIMATPVDSPMTDPASPPSPTPALDTTQDNLPIALRKGSDDQGIALLKQHLFSKFQTKDLGKLRYFLGIEVAQSQDGIALSQRKYALDILEETGLLDCRPVDTPMDPNVKLVSEQGDLLPNKEKYRRLIGKLNYLTITRPDISFAVSVLSQFLDKPCTGHWDAAIRVLRYIKKTPGQGLLFEDRGHRDIVGYCDADWAGCLMDRRSTSGYCILIGGNLISWKSKKQDVVARSSAEAEYRAMALVTCEILWLKHLLQELKYGNTKPAQLMCDNQAAMHIASNPVYHERTKHIEVDCHFIREKITSGHIITKYVNTTGQLADILTKSLRGPRVEYICNKLGTYDLYAPA